MRRVTLLRIPVLLLLLCRAGQTQRNIVPQVGDVATGKVMFELEGILQLNLKPCSGAARDSLMSFHKPYKKRALGEKTCPNGQTFPEFSVEQL